MNVLEYEDSGYRKKQQQKEKEEFAIEFAKWICEKADVPYIKGTLHNTLEIFKKEKGL